MFMYHAVLCVVLYGESSPAKLTCVARLVDLADWPMAAMLTLLEDCVSVVLPPSAAESPEMTSPLEKLRLPKRRLRVELDDDT